MSKTNERRMIFTTKMVDEMTNKIIDGVILKKFQNPWRVDGGSAQIGLRREGVVFKMTPEEQQEYIKCSLDVHYFAEKYCKVKREDGTIGEITLRDYQSDILSLFDENRFSILMAARQSGKCFSFNTFVDIKIGGKLYETRFGKLYYYIKKQLVGLTFLERIKIKLYDFLYLLEK